MSVIIFILVLGVLVLVHEWGHFIVAKKTGMRVDEFGIGFPPKLFGQKKGETEYTINLLPLGGFVKIYGENLEAIPDDDPEKVRAFGSRPKWAQAAVLVAGVTMNVIFAWFLFFVTFVVGVPSLVDESDATAEAKLLVTAVLPESPLAESLPPGVEIVAVSADNVTLNNPNISSFTDFIQEHPTSEMVIDYRHNEEEKQVSVTPQSGLISDDAERVAVGVSLAMLDTKKYALGEAFTRAFETTGNGLKSITVGIYTLIAGAVSGGADLTQVAGPVGIVGMVGEAASFGFTTLLTFTAIISLNLAVVNLLPIPALDGGRLLFVGIEAVTRKPINPAWAGRLNAIGFLLLMALMVFITYNDIVKIFH